MLCQCCQKALRKKPMMSRFFTGIALWCCSVFGVSAQTLTLTDAISNTLRAHPELRRFAHQATAAQAMITQAGAATPMQMNVGIENALGAGQQSSFKTAQTTLTMSWLLEETQRNAKQQVASRFADQVDIEQRITAIDLAAETATYFITLLAQQETLKLAKLAEREAQFMVNEIAHRVQAAQTHTVDLLRAKASLASKALVVEDLHHEIEASKAQLVAQWQGSLTEADLAQVSVQGELGRVPFMPEFAQLMEQLQQHPQLHWYASQQRIAQSQINLAKVTAQSAWRVTVGARRSEEWDDFSLLANLSIPFGGDDRNAGQIRALNAQQNEQQAKADAWRQRMYTQVLLITHKLKHNLHVVNGLQQEIIPALEAASAQAKAAYQAGSYRYSEWYVVQQELLTAKTQLISAFTNIQQFSIERERLTGATINHARSEATLTPQHSSHSSQPHSTQVQ